MARYDRIAAIPAPSREATFPGWLMFRDLLGRERDTELARRARLRFLALRPLRRILAAASPLSSATFARQIEGVREELGHLPARDAERIRLSRFLHEIERRTPAELPVAATGLGELAAEAGNASAAEEFFLTALELAARLEVPAAAAAALRRLATLCARLGRVEEAQQHLEAAAAAAAEAGAHAEWARAIADSALLGVQQGDGVGARSTLLEALQRGRAWGDAEVQSVAAVGLAAAALAAGDVEDALDRAWSALETARDAEARAAALGVAGAALRAFGLFEAAAQSYQLMLAEPVPPPEAWNVQAALTAILAESGRADQFLSARQRLLREFAEAGAPPRATSLLHLTLARACLDADARDLASEHLHDALAAARRGRCADLVAEVERMLPRLELGARQEPGAPPPEPGKRARAIAEAILARGAAVALV